MEEMIPIPNNNNNNNNPSNINNSRAPSSSVAGDQKRSRPQKDQNLNCPRCNSTNTKFCYYNNYSLTQPRYFCKTCRRYWTQGGSLRNVPVGGGSRKNKRSSSSSSSITSSSITTNTTPNNIIPTKLIPDLNPPNSLSHLINASHQNPKFLEGQDLNLAFPMQSIFHPNNNENNNHHEPINIMNNSTNHSNNSGNNHNNLSSNTTTNNNNTSSNTTANTSSSHPISALELLRTGIASRGSSLNPYVPIPMPDSNTLYPSGFPNLQEFKTNMSNVFSPPPPPGGGDHNNMVGSGGDHNNSGGARLLFPFADMNKLATSTPPSTNHHQDHIDDQSNKGSNDHHHHHNHHQGPTNGYWSGMLGGGTW